MLIVISILSTEWVLRWGRRPARLGGLPSYGLAWSDTGIVPGRYLVMPAGRAAESCAITSTCARGCATLAQPLAVISSLAGLPGVVPISRYFAPRPPDARNHY